ncbi:MAG: alcohol dehydrogenase catalytic domain-containing protein [Vicinamibacterales bacterium]
MKAIVRETYGPPDVLHLEDVPLPAVRDGDVLVKVRAASANAADWHLLRGTPLPFRLVAGLRQPKFKIIGNDIAGCVEAVGRIMISSWRQMETGRFGTIGVRSARTVPT